MTTSRAQTSDEPRGLEAAPHVLFVVTPDEASRALEADLRAAGYRVTACDVDAALSQVLEPIDLLITDHELPGRSGLEVAARVRRAQPSAKALVLSSLRVPPGLTSLPAPFCPRRPDAAELRARVAALTASTRCARCLETVRAS